MLPCPKRFAGANATTLFRHRRNVKSWVTNPAQLGGPVGQHLFVAQHFVHIDVGHKQLARPTGLPTLQR
jgi:hypothetical protein